MKPMPPGSIFHHISFQSTILVSDLLFLQSFTFRSINQKHQKYLLYRLSISIRSHFANIREGIDNPFVVLVASWCLFVQVFGGLLRHLLLVYLHYHATIGNYSSSVFCNKSATATRIVAALFCYKRYRSLAAALSYKKRYY